MNRGNAYLPEIDGLRALAVLSVVIFHAFPGALPGGFVGVDIFFVISGYLITGLLRAEWESKGKIDIAAFYARRARRILPMLVVVVLATLGAVAVLLDGRALHEAAQSATAALLFAANAYFHATTGGYFDPATDKLPLLHLWSLGVEEQFYLVWPLALGLLLARGRAGTVRCVAAAATVSALLAVAMCLLDPNAAFYLMPTRLWELAAGGLIALGAGGMARKPAPVALAGVALMIVAVSLPTKGLAAANVVLGTVGAALLIWAVHGRGALGAVGQVLRSRPAVFFGLISYSLYLWHWPLLAITRAMRPGEVPALLLAGLCVAAVGLSWLSYRFIETPFRRPRQATPNRRLVVASLLMCVSLSTISWSVAREVEPTAAPTVAPSWAEQVYADRAADPRNCRVIFNDKLDVFPKKNCERKGNSPVLYIWGDSHAFALRPFAAEVAAHEGLEMLSLTKDRCPPALGYSESLAKPLDAALCRKFNGLSMDQLRKGDTVFIVGDWTLYESPEKLLDGLSQSVAKAAATVKKVYLMGPSPLMRDFVPRCIAANDLDACAVTRAQFEAQAGPITEQLKAIAKMHRNVAYVSRADFFCDVDVCPPTRGDMALYFDAGHPTTTAAKAFAAAFLRGAD